MADMDFENPTYDEVLAAIQEDAFAICDAPMEFQRDEDLIMEALKINIDVIEELAVPVASDDEFMRELIEKVNVHALAYASDELRYDKELLLRAIERDSEATEYVPKEFWSDRDFLLEVVKRDGYALGEASAELKDDVGVVRTAVDGNPEAIKFASPRIQANPSLVGL